MEWIISANPKYYDHIAAFKDLQTLDWGMKGKCEIGDIVFIYTSTPIRAIQVAAQVVDINIGLKGRIDDARYYLDEKGYEQSLLKTSMTRLKLLCEFNEKAITFDELSEHGLKGILLGPRKLRDKDNNLTELGCYLLERLKEY